MSGPCHASRQEFRPTGPRSQANGRARRQAARGHAKMRAGRRPDMNVGFIGLGLMGASMASNLQAAGHTLVVHDVRKPAAAPHVAAGAVWKDTPRAVAE